jgi:RNA polymerase sigma-70 factor (ECF subfamily)
MAAAPQQPWPRPTSSPSSKSTAATCCGSRACNCATTSSPRTASRTRWWRPFRAPAGFSGKSSVKTWLTGILRHKIVDAIRRKTSAPVFETLDDECQIDDFDALFNESGHWTNPPADWGNPEGDLERQDFMKMMEFCLEKLPPNTARVFMMREVMELESDEICKELAITSTNLWVIMYRARMSLRECLEQNWFGTR